MKKKDKKLELKQQGKLSEISQMEQELIDKEKEKAKNNEIKNKPIVLITYMMVLVFVSLIGYIIYFMQFKAEGTIANSRNVRQDDFADKIERGDIITSDGVVIATNEIDGNGDSYRYYPYSNMFAHVVGYEANGKSGLELQGNFYLLRTHINIVERVTKELKEEKNRGDNLVTTIDYNLQSTAYNSLGSCNGAAIVIEPSTGKILAMVSKPDFDPNYIYDIWDSSNSSSGEDGEDSYFLNRATQGMYAPGSTFKIVTLLEYMREKSNYKDYSFECYGSDVFSGVSIHCSDDRNHGSESLADSLAYSCNVSFANIGSGLNYDEYGKTAKRLLFNSELPYDGVYNESEFYINSKSEAYQIPQTAIGQGDTKITPLHNAMIMSSIANGGYLMKPYLIDHIENDDGVTVKKFSPKGYGNLLESDEASKLIEYMKGVCDYGTASGYFSDTSYDVAGKTGTAEYDDEGNCNSWFVGFSNPDNPDIVVCVIVEDSNTMGVSGTWVARQIFDAYYNR